MNSVFNETILADKLSKLNNTQQCIESILPAFSLSHWCIFHRKNAEQVIQTWDKQFHCSKTEQKGPFLYLANDILQNSKQTGTEFVSEFWKVLPSALKDVLENGDEYGKNVVSRLVDIREQRRIFGSRARDLKKLMLASEPPDLDLNKKLYFCQNLRRDSRSVKIEGQQKKLFLQFSVLGEHSNVESDLDRCKSAVRYVGKLEKDMKTLLRESLATELQEQEVALKDCIERLKLAEANRSALVTQLKVAMWEQESQLENVRSKVQVHASNFCSDQKNCNMAAGTSHVLSTFAAEATNNVDPATSTNLPNSHSAVAPDRRMITENPMPISDTSTTSLIPFQPIVVSTPHQQAVLLQLGLV
ncbi:hypothetical protein ZIOFF_074841 [Zingiber officinale]|uniref:CID domain-containing protein n=1 Tax=Zingiber officinale TaxID=94328 RepID=A0A8J5ESY3_ZINOF|nr:hypothetical protein ZIOFF_074841 [Zingiber officinale]